MGFFINQDVLRITGRINFAMVTQKYKYSMFYELLRDIEISYLASLKHSIDRFSKKILLYSPAGTGKAYSIKCICKELDIGLYDISFYDEQSISQVLSDEMVFSKEFNIIYIKNVNIGQSKTSHEINQLLARIEKKICNESDAKIMLVVSTTEYHSSIYNICNDFIEYKFGALTLFEKVSFTKKYWKYLLKTMSDIIEIQLAEKIIKSIVKNYTNEAGIFQLRNCIEQLFDYILLYKEIVEITEAVVIKALGNPKYVFDNIEIDQERGNGLAWTPYGGKVLNLEVITKVGNGKVNVLGNIKPIMVDSIFMAYQVLYNNSNRLNVLSEELVNKDFWFSIPELAENKDGASMGLAVFFKLYCIVTDKHIDKPIALSGELMFNGDLIRVGGLREKLNAAYSHNIQDIFLPYKAKNEIDRLPSSLVSKLHIHFLNNVFELIPMLEAKKFFK